MIVLDVVMAGHGHTERRSIASDESVTIETRHGDKPAEMDAELWNWIERHFDNESDGLDGNTVTRAPDDTNTYEIDVEFSEIKRHYASFAEFVES